MKLDAGRNTMIRTIAATLVMMSLGTRAALADSITMKTLVTLAANTRAITLGDVAELHGEYAQRYADIVLLEIDESAKPITITVQQVRSTLDAADAHWGLVDLNGRTVNVQTATRLAGAPQAMTGATIGERTQVSTESESKTDSVLATSILHQRTAASVIAATLAQRLEIDPIRLRVAFATADKSFLDLPTAQYRFEIQSTSNLEADRVTLQIRAWQRERITHRQAITVGVEVHVETAIAGRDIRRGTVLVAGDVKSESQWVGAGMLREMIDIDDLAGRIATTSLKQGERFSPRDVKRQTLIERGDVVRVRCLVGGVALALQAEARADGSEGDTIEFRKLGERETFLAKVTGRAEAIIDLARR